MSEGSEWAAAGSRSSAERSSSADWDLICTRCARGVALLASLVGLVKHRPAAPARIRCAAAYGGLGTDGHGFFPAGGARCARGGLLASLVRLVKHRPAAPARIWARRGTDFFPQGVLAALVQWLCSLRSWGWLNTDRLRRHGLGGTDGHGFFSQGGLAVRSFHREGFPGSPVRRQPEVICVIQYAGNHVIAAQPICENLCPSAANLSKSVLKKNEPKASKAVELTLNPTAGTAHEPRKKTSRRRAKP